jgi:hypothetical protein
MPRSDTRSESVKIFDSRDYPLGPIRAAQTPGLSPGGEPDGGDSKAARRL